MLVRVASGLEVELDHRLRLPGRGEDRIDLYLPQVPLMIDLDPAWSHKNQSSQARDAAKTRALRAAGQDFERIRERGLPPVPIDGLAHHKAGPGVDAEDWAAVIGSMLRQRGLPWKDLDSEQINTAFEAANQLWQKVIAGPAVTALNVAPHLEAEFVANRTNPGRGLDRMPPGSNDLCAWRCLVADCGYEWDAPVASRALAGRGCRACGWRKTSAANSRPGPGESLADVAPALAEELLEVVGHPGWAALDLLPYSNKPCRWRCSKCNHIWTGAPSHRVREQRGCPPCARERTTAGRIRPRPGKSLQDVFPGIAAELLHVIDHPEMNASDLRPSPPSSAGGSAANQAAPASGKPRPTNALAAMALGCDAPPVTHDVGHDPTPEAGHTSPPSTSRHLGVAPAPPGGEGTKREAAVGRWNGTMPPAGHSGSGIYVLPAQGP
ncbi:hypothetical protein STENM327S_02294 [Streptomyces tendae]